MRNVRTHARMRALFNDPAPQPGRPSGPVASEPKRPAKVAAGATLAVLSLFTLAACGDGDEAGDAASHGMSSMMSEDSSPSAEPGAADDATAEHNDADVRFAQEMIPHHAQAVRTAQMAGAAAESEEVKGLAADIEAAQDPEIDMMSGWLESWGEDVPGVGMGDGDDGHGAAGDNMDEMDDMGHDSDAADEMSGMMSGEAMRSLEKADGRTFDRMFLEMMIEHHEGAVDMARTEQAEGKFPDAIALAETIEKAQTAEIATMRELLGS